MYITWEGDHGVWLARFATHEHVTISSGQAQGGGCRVDTISPACSVTGTGRVHKGEDTPYQAIARAIANLEDLAIIEERKNQVTSV